jgi:hypothetical protein
LLGVANPVSQRIREHDPAETYYGAYRSERLGHNLNLVDGHLLEVSDFDRDAAREAGAVRAELP